MIDLEKLPPEAWEMGFVEGFGPVRHTLLEMMEAVLRARFRVLLEGIPPDMLALMEALRAYDAGDEEPIEKWVEEFVGKPLDPVLRSALKSWLVGEIRSGLVGRPWVRQGKVVGVGRRAKQVPLFGLYQLARYHRRRATTPGREWYKERAAEVDAILKKDEGWELMQSLEVHGGRRARLKALEGILPGAVMGSEEQGHYLGDGGKLVGATERIIIKDNRLLMRTQKPLRDEDDFLLTDENGKAIPYRIISAGDLEGMIDPSALDEYAEIEDEAILDAVIAQAILAPREEEIARLAAQGLRAVDIAAKLGTKPSTVRSQLGVIYTKVSSACA